MIWHIFKKDFRLHWHFAAGVAALGWLGIIVLYRGDYRGFNPQRMWGITNLLLVLQLVASGILSATVVQTDTIPGVRQDWLIRPIRRRDLLCAKLLFVLALVQGPVFIGDLVEALADGFSLPQALFAALVRAACLLCVVYLPVMAFASITRTFTENIVAVVAAVAFYSMLITTANAVLPLSWYPQSLGSTGIDWMSELAMVVVAAVGASMIVALQYFKRRLLAGRCLAAVCAVLCLAANIFPWQPAFAIQQHLSPHPGGASAVSLAFQPDLGRYNERSPLVKTGYRYRREEGTSVFLPIRVSGLGPDTILRTDRLQPRLFGPDGRNYDLAPVIPPLVTSEGYPQSAADGRMTYGLVVVPAIEYEKLRNQPVRVELEYSLTLLRLDQAHAIPALNARQNVPDFGSCETEVNRAGTAVLLRCMMNPRTPPCATFFLEHPSTGKRNPENVLCQGQYTPLYMQYEPDALRRARIELPFRAPSDLYHMPVDGPQLPESRVVMRFYEPVEHFTRHVVIPDVRLNDWLPL